MKKLSAHQMESTQGGIAFLLLVLYSGVLVGAIIALVERF